MAKCEIYPSEEGNEFTAGRKGKTVSVEIINVTQPEESVPYPGYSELCAITQIIDENIELSPDDPLCLDNNQIQYSGHKYCLVCGLTIEVSTCRKPS